MDTIDGYMDGRTGIPTVKTIMPELVLPASLNDADTNLLRVKTVSS
jgi:hypothetical protein